MLEIRQFNVKLQSRILWLDYKTHEVAFACLIHGADFYSYGVYCQKDENLPKEGKRLSKALPSVN